ncbi:TIGR01244 family sulfur transferase [Sphingobium sp. Ndbn-10]|uniref:TIGR01244 family sulfur transferase n=1 Tax=Sphingobium sp. Ndbn-10 TaxID=1667223 RepID=UPI000818A691|nr:TIGR01244 family sulfur transferase [Sphingobium sp. Ndbn-10]
MTQPKRLSDRLSVTPQIDPADMQDLAAAGFRSVISNRPDGEDPDQPDWATIEQAARRAGMEARHIPVTPGAITNEDAARFRAALEELPEPIVGFCRTGARSTSLWALSNTDQRPAEELIRAAADAGYDIAALRDCLAQS